jgi:hypothetical protein
MSEVVASLMNSRDFSYEVEFPDEREWQATFLEFGGVIGVTTSTGTRPSYVDWTVTTSGAVIKGPDSTESEFLFSLADDAVGRINHTVSSRAQIPGDASAFGVFPAQFKSRIGRAIEDFARARGIRLNQLSAVRIAISGSAGVRVVWHALK